ncbi:hypothetical protein D6833_06795 [Candidatus Parcubacteria bacterium]|nr:MAG: hypothetical protein D6833_06795 [Candidatus Parcubacteria bacterium]
MTTPGEPASTPKGFPGARRVALSSALDGSSCPCIASAASRASSSRRKGMSESTARGGAISAARTFFVSTGPPRIPFLLSAPYHNIPCSTATHKRKSAFPTNALLSRIFFAIVGAVLILRIIQYRKRGASTQTHSMPHTPSWKRRQWGQHFLNDHSIIQRILDEVRSFAPEVVVEIGAGKGALTLPLARDRSAPYRRIIAIEKDRRLAAALARVLPQCPVPTVLQEGDARELLPKLPSSFPRASYIVMGSIPYSLTGILLRKIGELTPPPRGCLLVVQKEVAHRIVAAAPRASKLALSVQFWALPHLLAVIPRASFSPPPRVDSALIKLTARRRLPCNREHYYATLHAAFAHPRKTLANNLKTSFPETAIRAALSAISLPPSARAQLLTPATLCTLSRLLYF